MTTRLNKEVDITMTFIFFGRKTTSLLHLQNATCTYNNNFHFRQQVMQMIHWWEKTHAYFVSECWHISLFQKWHILRFITFLWW